VASRRLPSGVVTLVMTDVVGSTRLWERSAAAMDTALRRHGELIDAAVSEHRGRVLKARGEGDSTFSVFARASDAIRAVVDAQRTLVTERWPESVPLSVRIAVHTGEAVERDGDFFGPAVNRAARLRAIASGGAIFLSGTTADLVADDLPAGVRLVELGTVRLRDVERTERVFALEAEGVRSPSALPDERAAADAPEPPARRGVEEPIRVAVVDDQALVRSGFSVLLNAAPDLEVVGEAADGRAAVELAMRERPDVVLMDIRMPEMDGVEATRRITSDERLSSTRVLVLTTFDLDEYVFDALRAGASGFLLKDILPDDLLAAVRVVASGEALLDPGVTRRLVEEFLRQSPPPSTKSSAELADLTPRETEVLTAVAHGLSNTEIAATLFMSHATAKTHVSRLLTKLQARDRAQLVMIAYEVGVVAPRGGTPGAAAGPTAR
jgi:DNA-binding NarL/FixJ family response regulator/class 3 adenylate cyclase